MAFDKLKSPYPYFGGKSRVAPIVWKALGNVSNYVEPFAGSIAVLLANPNPAKIETINDIDCQLTNFWRSVSKNPQEVAKYAIYPVNEVELHARHRYLISISEDLNAKMEQDIDYIDVKAAGYWVYGISNSVGNNWLQPKGLNAMPILSSAGGGISGLTANPIIDFELLMNRLKRVRVLCGDYKRILTPSVTYKNVGISSKDVSGIFLDPPYCKKNRDKVYIKDEDIFEEVCKFAIENGENEKLRIAVCGYDDGIVFPDNWQKFAWKSNGGLANLGDNQGRINSNKETIWFSPHCLKIKDDEKI